MLLVPWLSAATAITLADRSEVRARPELAGENRVVLDVETRPEVALALTSRRTRLEARYAVSLTAFDLTQPSGVVYQSLDGTASFRLRKAMIYLRESSGYGQRNLRLAGLSAPAATPAPAEPAEPGTPTTPQPTTPVPNRTEDQALSYASMAVGAGMSALLSRRLTLNLELNYGVSGGLDNETVTRDATTSGTTIGAVSATSSYPLQRIETAQARLDAQLSRKDVLSWRANASQFETSPEISAFVASAEQLYAHRLSRNASFGLSAGVAYVQYRAAADLPRQREVQPLASAELGVEHRRGPLGTSFGVDVSLAPIVDRRTGLVDERANFNLRGGTFNGPWSLTLQAAGTRSLDQDSISSLTVLQGSGALGYALSKRARVEAGSAMTLQATGGSDTLTPIWGIFAALTLQSRPLRL